MALFDFKKIVNESTEMFKSGAHKAQEVVKNVDVQAVADEITSKGKDAAKLIKHKTGEAGQHVLDSLSKKEEIYGMITVKGSLKLMCMVMAIDGNIADEELTKICEMGSKFDTHFPEYQESLICECTSIVNKINPEEFEEDVNDTARDIINISLNVPGANVPVKLLLWDLLVVALSDNNYLKEESKFIRYIAKRLGVDKSIIPEMEVSIQSLFAVENEITWLKTTDRQFSVVDPLINELNERKDAIMQGVQMLIND